MLTTSSLLSASCSVTWSVPVPVATDAEITPTLSSAPTNRNVSLPASPVMRRRSMPLPVNELAITLPSISLMISWPLATEMRNELLVHVGRKARGGRRAARQGTALAARAAPRRRLVDVEHHDGVA